LLSLRGAVKATLPIYSMFSEIHKMVSCWRELGPVQSCQNSKMNISERSCVLLCFINPILESHGHRPGALSCLISFSSEASRTPKDSNCKFTRPFPWFQSSDEGVFVAFCFASTPPPSDRKRSTWVEALAEACCGKLSLLWKSTFPQQASVEIFNSYSGHLARYKLNHLFFMDMSIYLSIAMSMVECCDQTRF